MPAYAASRGRETHFLASTTLNPVLFWPTVMGSVQQRLFLVPCESKDSRVSHTLSHVLPQAGWQPFKLANHRLPFAQCWTSSTLSVPLCCTVRCNSQSKHGAQSRALLSPIVVHGEEHLSHHLWCTVKGSVQDHSKSPAESLA